MKTSNKYNLFILLTGMTISILLGYCLSKRENGTKITETVETYYDTIPYYAPKQQSELALGTSVYTLPATSFQGGGSGGKPRRQNTDSKIVAQDTIRVPMYGTSAGGEPRCSSDSAVVELPIIQRHYADSTYEAWVSGPLDPKLDSLRIFQPTTIITRQDVTKSKQKHWHLGVTGGYGYSVKGFQPYIGIGITYSVLSF